MRRVYVSIPIQVNGKDAGTLSVDLSAEEFKRVLLAADIAFRRQENPKPEDTSAYQWVVEVRHHLQNT